MSSANSKPAFGVFNGLAPEELPKGLPYTYDFSTDTAVSFDLQLENTNGIIQMVQSVYVDNSDNNAALTLRFTITGQRLVVPANSQGIWPVIAPLQTQITASTTPAADLRVHIILLNVPMPYTQWGPITVNTGAITAQTEATATAAAPAYIEGTDNMLSMDLAGNLRVIGTVGVTTMPLTQVQGNVASGVADSGNPVKVGGIVETAALPTFADGDRANLTLTNGGALLSAVAGLATPAADGRSNSDVIHPLGMNSGNVVSTVRSGLSTANMVFNGATWDRQRGDTTGTHTVGNVADNAVDAGNPVKVGARYNSADQTYANGDRADLQADINGRVKVLTQRSATGTQTAVAGSVAAQTLLAANVARKGASIANDSSADLYIKLGAGVTTTSFSYTLAAKVGNICAVLEVPADYTGVIEGLWSAAAGNARITERT